MNDTPDDPTGADRAKDAPAGAAPKDSPAKDSPAKDSPAKEAGKSGKRASLRSPNDALQPDAAPPPPEEKKKKRRDSLSGTLSGLLSFVVVLGLLGLGVVAFGMRLYNAPGPLPADKIVLVTRGAGVGDILDQLEREGVISDTSILRSAIYAQNLQSKVLAGEFSFKANATPKEVLATLLAGKSIQHALTIPEGLTSEQIVQRVRENDVLIGDVRETPKEGMLAPNTYNFSRGTTREKFLSLMREQQARILEEVWQKRAPSLPVKSSYELLTLASIVEKETGKAEERPRVASVFVNRLQKGMRLQSDPTIVYGLVGGRGSLGRGITRGEIAQPTAYNTYVISGLPPGPIANPGRASLEAAANPLKTSDLYFVADGTGGHVFAPSLNDHNRNVQRWRSIERDAKDRSAADVADPADAPAVEPAPAIRPRRGGALEGGGAFGALPSRLGVGDAAHAAVTAGPNLVRAAGATLGAARRAPVESSRDWAGRMALAFAAPTQAGHAAAAPGAQAIEAAIPAAKAEPAPRQASPAPDMAAAPDRVIPGDGVPANDPNAPASPYAFQSVADSFNIVGVTVTEGGLDLQPDPDQGAPAATGPMVTFPVSAARQADLRARAAQYGGGLPATGALPITGGVRALPIIDAPPLEAAAAPAAGAPKRPRIVDASEGTRLDPLKMANWDLNSPKSVPDMRPLR